MHKHKEEMKKNKGGWNYRVVREKDRKLKGCPQTYSWSIRDVYYKNNKPYAWGAEPQYPVGETWEEVRMDLLLMMEAFTKPPLKIIKREIIEMKTK